MSNSSLPILYSFRRCPYAMRARLAIAAAGIDIEHREVDLRNKPIELIKISPKATVPVIQLSDTTTIEESLDIMYWALQQNDPNDWLQHKAESLVLIQKNDDEFKPLLDRYKYSVGYPERSQTEYRNDSLPWLNMLNERIKQQGFLMSSQPSLADIAIFPFIRQFAFVDKNWFKNSPYQHLNQWLDQFLDMPLFAQIMIKHPIWQASNNDTLRP